jgi:AcrR family transcriptional regulator
MADQLRARRLPPGPSNTADTVARNQRERIFGATVATVAAHGYETTRVADILAVAGVSRNAFYRHFDNKLECFLATIDAIAALAGDQLARVYGDESRTTPERLRGVLEGLVEMVLEQPAAARVWLVEIYAAGPRAVDRMERLADKLELLAGRSIGGGSAPTDMPVEGVRAVLGGVRQIVHTRLRHGREEELPALVPDLLEWALDYSSPPTRLRKPRRPPRLPVPTPDPDPQRRRILAAVTDLVAERGYQRLTITEIAQRAAISLSTFYDHFPGKRDALIAAIDDGERQLLEVALPAYELAPDWPSAMRDVIHATFAFNATHPALARLSGMRIFSGGASGLNRHEDTIGRFDTALRDGYREYPGTSTIVGEAIGGSLAALLYQQIRRRGPESLYEVAGIASFLALAPFVGAADACDLANERWRPAQAPR